MKKVVATGTFDILHPGHLFYLEESGNLGDHLSVIIARDVNIKHKPKPVVPEYQRLRMVSALKPVDYARLGDDKDMFLPIEEINPDIITIGFNQYFNIENLKKSLIERGIEADVVRVGAYEGEGFCSSRNIMEEILIRRCSGSD
ncbi:adenylyltransferase/cytidyltransferase family protein [Methanoplanus limicola]|uniref:adenylyltransferase/cytidyltransferase family protein n=1 Tax=Methanoplanus limicola TaxID=2315 RepID=UPI00064FA91F|nr:adenylyltransferase/cytidyltransferase family protein [Methanoplanus limicola]